MKVQGEGLSFAYGRVRVLSGVSLELPEGGITVVIGPSGSGKSTLLQLLAGLLRPTAGRILFDGENVTGVPARRRGAGVVFQTDALLPRLTVRQNIAFGLRAGRHRISLRTSRRRPSRHQIDCRVWDAASLLGLERLLDRRPSELSSGEQRRVALARAVAPRPSLLLLDEPLWALDAPLRRAVRCELAGLLRRLGTTVFHVTHDREEALLLADHLVVLNAGRVEQAGPPLELYRCPATPFVAQLLGEANLLEASVVDGGGRRRLETPLGRLATCYPGPDRRGWLLVRPEDVVEDALGTAATVVDTRGLGPYDRVVLQLAGGTEVLAHFPPETAPFPGATLRVGVRPRRHHFLGEGSDAPRGR